MANGKLKKKLGMTKRPTAAGQEKFGDVDVTGETSSSQPPLSRRQQDILDMVVNRPGSSDPTSRAKAAGWKGYDEDLWPMGPKQQAERFLLIGNSPNNRGTVR